MSINKEFALELNKQLKELEGFVCAYTDEDQFFANFDDGEEDDFVFRVNQNWRGDCYLSLGEKTVSFGWYPHHSKRSMAESVVKCMADTIKLYKLIGFVDD